MVTRTSMTTAVVTVLLTALAVVTAVLPLSLGCSMDTVQLTIRCRSNNLDYIVKSMYILVPDKASRHNDEDTVVVVESPQQPSAPRPASGGNDNDTTTSTSTSLSTATNDTVAEDTNSSINNSSNSNNSTDGGGGGHRTVVVVKQQEPQQQQQLEPRELDIYYCDVPELPNVFARLNASLERIRVARSGVQSVTVNAFEGLETKLRFLDLSGNKLLTVPLAIANLTRLEVLNLRDNKIQVIAEGPTFYRTVRLRELHLGFNNLGYIDNSRLQLYSSGSSSSPSSSSSSSSSSSGTGSGSTSQMKSAIGGSTNTGSGSGSGSSSSTTGSSAGVRRPIKHAPIGLAVFSLGNTTASLEVLSLRGNAFSNYPEQLMADFPRLKSLDLSFNSLVEVPEDAFRAMPELQFVNLDANFIRTLRFSNLPETLKLFTMKNNPMRCDCDVRWILDWIYTNTSLTVLLPKCNAPFHLREISFLRLTADKLCNQSHVARQTVYVTDRDLGYFPIGVFQSIRLREVHGEFRSVFVSWKVDPQFYLSQREWLIIYRSLDDDDGGGNIYTFNRTLFTSRSYVENQTDWTTVERVFNDNIRNLSAGQLYQVCLALVENNINYIHLNHCRVAQTEPEAISPSQQHPFSSQSTATSSSSSSTEPPRPDYLIDSRLARIKADGRSLTVYWNVVVRSSGGGGGSSTAAINSSTATLRQQDESSPLQLNTLTAIYNELRWKITFRRFSSKTTTAVTIMKNNYVVTGPNTHQYTIANLQPGTGYAVCFETINDLSPKGNRLLTVDGATPSGVASGAAAAVGPYVSFDEGSGAAECSEVLTVADRRFPATEVAVAAIVSLTSTTVVLVALFYFARKRIVAACDPSSKFSSSSSSVPSNDTDDMEIASDTTDMVGIRRHGGTTNRELEDDDDDDDDDEDEDRKKPLPATVVAAAVSMSLPPKQQQQQKQQPPPSANGHIKRWPSYPKVTSIYPTDEFRNGVYHSSFRHFGNGIPTYGSTQRNGTYPKSILKKSPSAPSLTDAVVHAPGRTKADLNGHLPDDYDDDDDDDFEDDDDEDPVAKFEKSARNGEVELRKIFMADATPDAGVRPKSS